MTVPARAGSAPPTAPRRTRVDAEAATGSERSVPVATVTFGDDRRAAAIPRWMVLVLLIAAQSALARLLIAEPIACLALLVALVALTGWGLIKRDPQLLVSIAAYLPGAEIMWRQAAGPVPSQAAPYLLFAIGVAATAALLPGLTKAGRYAVLYLAIQLPAMVLTIGTAGGLARQAISFALSGPAALAALVVLLSQVRLNRWLYRRLLWVAVISAIGPLVIAVTAISQYIGSGQAIRFTDESNFVTSGGFGPVQVSSLLGLGVVLAILLVLVEDELVPRLIATALALAFGAQSLLTFSRGGMVAAGFAVGALVISMARGPYRKQVFAIVVVLLAVGNFVVIPRLDSFTQGKFSERYSDTTTTRTNLADNDLEIFERNVVLGVGPGMTKFQRLSFETCQLRSDRCAEAASSHTEFTRLLSEHGILGIGAIALLAAMAIEAVRRAGRSRPHTVTLLTWAVAQMFYANIRIAAIAFAFAFAFVRIGPADDTDREVGEPSPVGEVAGPPATEVHHRASASRT